MLWILTGEMKIAVKQRTSPDPHKTESPQTTYLRSLRTLNLVRVMGLENYSDILYFSIKSNE